MTAKVNSTDTLIAYLNAKEEGGEELTDDDAETMINELENLE